MTNPTTLLRCARLANRDCIEPGRTCEFKAVHNAIFCDHCLRAFNPHDPTKGDLQALQNVLEKEGWQFFYNIYAGWYARKEFKELSADSPAERAIRCVEAMEPE